MPTLHEDDGVFVLDLGDGENRFAPEETCWLWRTTFGSCVELARPLTGKDYDTLRATKSTMFASAVTALGAPEPAAQP